MFKRQGFGRWMPTLLVVLIRFVVEGSSVFGFHPEVTSKIENGLGAGGLDDPEVALGFLPGGLKLETP